MAIPSKMVVKGLDKLQKNFDKLSKKYEKRIIQASFKSGQLVRTTAIKSIQSASMGTHVERSRMGGGTYSHIASKPNSAPNTDTGRLVQSIQVEIKRKGVYVGSSLIYAGYLEFGTKRMDARPWLNPALESSRMEIKKIMKDAIKGVK